MDNLFKAKYSQRKGGEIIMKRLGLFFLVAACILVAAVAFAGISSTKHNLTSSNTTSTHTTDTNATLCGFCHIPHGGDTTVSNAPLWARQLRNTTTNPYTVYGGGTTLGGTTVGQPGTNSLTCLSCHDGTVGLGVTYKNGVQATNYPMTSPTTGMLDADNSFANWFDPTTGYAPNIAGAGNDLTNDHPVGLIYDPTKAGLDTLANAQSRGYKFYGASSNRVECASCHDPHISTTTKFKRDISGVDFCVGCHYNK